MNDTWQKFLLDQGVDVAIDQLVRFAGDAEGTDTGELDDLLVDLSLFGLIKISGEDATGFLQNLLTNDMQSVTAENSQLTGLCTAKGRLLAVFRLFKQEADYYLRLPLELVEPLIKRLKMYVLMSKVTVAHADNLIICGVHGESAFLQDTLGSVPDQVGSASHSDNLTVLRVPGEDRYELYGSQERIQPLWMELSNTLTAANSAAWRLLDIRNGIPQIYAATSEHFVPQMVNLNLVDGVSFKKGCFPGQEVVARMQYLGKLKRRMYRVRIESAKAPPPGTPVVALENGKTHEAGEIVDACVAGQSVEALAVLPSASIDHKLHIADTNGPELEILTLPYSFTQNQNSD
jgi:folate-binding protein YgfZ